MVETIKPFGAKSMRFINNPVERDCRINILEGAVRSSKTFTMIPKWLEYIRRGPKGLLIMTGVTKDTIFDNVLDDFLDIIGKDGYEYNSNSGTLKIIWQEGNQRRVRRIKVVGAKDEGSEKYLRGKTLAGAYCDELSLMPEKFFKQLLNRLSVEGAKLYGTTNPDSPFHFLYEEYITDEEKRKSGMIRVWHFDLEDNPNLEDEYLEFIRNAYTGMWYKRMILGQWVLGEGRIYDMYSEDEGGNLVDDEDVPPGLVNTARRFIAVDYGTTNPCVFLDIYDDGEYLWLLNEYYYDSREKGKGQKEKYQKEDDQYADDMDTFVGDGQQPDFIIIDPSAASFKVKLRNRGYRLKDADNDVSDGIRMVGSLLHRRVLKIHKRCKYTRREFGAYSWDEKARQRGEEKVIKLHDHAMDGIRYFVKTMISRRRFAA